MRRQGLFTATRHGEPMATDPAKPARRAWVAGALGLATPVLDAEPGPVLALPAAQSTGTLALEAALSRRRSLREFAPAAIGRAQAGQLLWAAQGMTDARGRRTAPSAGALYPLTLYLVAGQVDGVESGLYRYDPQGHALQRVDGADLRTRIAAAAVGQSWIAQAPAIVAFAARVQRTAPRYGERAGRYVAIEVGAATQNLLLQAVALGLGGTAVGAFDDAALGRLLALPDGEAVLLLVPVGHAR